DLGQLAVHDFGRPERNEVLYTAQKAQIGVERTVLSVTEIYHKPDIYVANTTVLDDIQYLVNLRLAGTLVIETWTSIPGWLASYQSINLLSISFTKEAKKVPIIFSPLESRIGGMADTYLSLPPQTPQFSPEQVRGDKLELARQGLLPRKPQKLMVLLVHGGPKSRDFFGFAAINAWLTSRGYAVMQVNFRVSVGFGKNLTNTGNSEWGRKMHQDLLDGVGFLVSNNIADRRQVAIMGGSYRGYATLVGMTFTPDIFACGVDIVGPSNLITLLDTIPPYWLGFYNDMIGANDPRVKQAESDKFVAALKRNHIPVTYILFPDSDEGHGHRKPHNTMTTAGFSEEFLAQCLHRDVEPFNLGQYTTPQQW
uniref:Peptidase_S9 domain-containing protein n=1 Tax=Globodera pallida TaxID=36090 RepID=A0A183CPA6_GLOPA